MPPTRNHLLLIAAVAIVLRVIVFAVSTTTGHVTFAQYTAKGDTTSYLAIAAAMSGERGYASLDEYDRRVFPGYPAMIAVVHATRISLPMAALVVTWISAGLAAAAAATAFSDVRVGWAMTCLIPHYLINSSLGMSEAPLLAALCLGLVLSCRKRFISCGIVFGAAMLIRPMGGFALAGLLFTFVRNRRWSRAVNISIISSVTFALGFLAMQWWTGNAMQGIHVYANHPGAYAGHMIVWPFQSLISESRHASLWRNAYIWIHVWITLLAVVLAGWQSLIPPLGQAEKGRGRPDARDTLSFAWLLCNTAMILCLGPPWGFAHFPRFSIPAEPAMFWTLRNMLPRSKWIWAALAGLTLIVAAIGVIDSR